MRSVTRVCDVQSSSLEEYCKARSATIQSVGQAAWAHILAAYTGVSNITFGTVFSNRTASPSQATAFPCLSTIPVVCNSDRDFDDTVAGMVSYNSSAHRHRLTPLADIQRYAGDAHRPLFDTVFVYQKTNATLPLRFNWTMIRETAAVDYAASLELEVHSDGTVSVRMTADCSKVPQEQAALMLLQYDYFLTRIVNGSSDRDRASIFSVVPATAPDLPSNLDLLHHFVETTAQQKPDSPALEFVWATGYGRTKTVSWTYRQLDQRANQVAHLLGQGSISPGSIVAVRMRQCPEASFAFVGILKAGCSFLALDPDLPAARQVFILEDSKAAALITDHGTAEHDAAMRDLQLARVELTEQLLSQYPNTAVPTPAQKKTETCYCLYTSGTTGAPKGCEITHENAVQAMLAFQRLFRNRWTESSRWLQFASYWFDVSVLEQFWSWSVGIVVVGAARDIVLDNIPAFIQQQRITHVDLTPSLARLVDPDDVPSLHGGVFITGGEALKQEIIDAWGPKFTICNGYGPTEVCSRPNTSHVNYLNHVLTSYARCL